MKMQSLFSCAAAEKSYSRNHTSWLDVCSTQTLYLARLGHFFTRHAKKYRTQLSHQLTNATAAFAIILIFMMTQHIHFFLQMYPNLPLSDEFTFTCRLMFETDACG